jgi:hypothetical protein
VGAKPPQAAAGVHDHVTPWFRLSLATVATMLAAPRMSMDEGGGVLRVTEIPVDALIAICAEIDFVGSVAEVAVTVTYPFVGTVTGAV